MSNDLDTKQDRHSICPVLGPNSLQRSSADDKFAVSKECLPVDPAIRTRFPAGAGKISFTLSHNA